MSGPLGFEDDDGRDDAPEAPRSPSPDAPDAPGSPSTGPSPGEPPRERLPGSGANTARYGWIAGAVALVVLVYIGLNTLRSSGDGVGSKGPKNGTLAHAFAGPLATSALEGDVNVATKDDSGEAGKIAACRVHVAGAFNACDLWKAKPAAILFFVDRSGQCVKELDTFQQVVRRHPGIGVVAVSIKGKRAHVADLVRSHGWTFPVVYDHDGILANFYGVAVCPQVTYVRKGGRVAGTNIGKLSAPELEAQLKALEAGARDVVT